MRKRTMVALTVTAAILASGAITVLTSQPAFAHGAMQAPASRLYACYVDGLTTTGEIKPKNPACAAAVAAGGTQPLYDWYGDNRFDGAGQTAGFIPDGQICSGANPKYAAYDTPSADWPTTNVTPGATFNFVYGAWVPHPGAFKLYVTKDGFDPTKTLTWADMEPQPFLTVDPEPGVVDLAYRFSGKLPSNKQGRHIIYSVWYRSDSKETFYNCSDVNFGGTGGSSPPPSASPSPSTSPSTSASAAPSASASMSGPGVTPTPSTGGGTGGCAATATVASSWPNGFQSDVTIKNTGTTALTEWYVSFTLPSGVTVGQGWNGTFMQNGATAMVHPSAWNAYLAPGATATAGFLGTGNTGTPTISGVSCG